MRNGEKKKMGVAQKISYSCILRITNKLVDESGDVGKTLGLDEKGTGNGLPGGKKQGSKCFQCFGFRHVLS